MKHILRKLLVWIIAVAVVLPAIYALSNGDNISAKASEFGETALVQPQLLTPAPGALVKDEIVQFSWQAVEPAGIEYTVSIDGFPELEYLNDKLSLTVSLSNYLQGSHYWSVTAKRISDGETSSSENRNFYLDTIGPAFTAESLMYEADCGAGMGPFGESKYQKDEFTIPLNGDSSCYYQFNLAAHFSEALSNPMHEMYLRELTETQKSAWVESIAGYNWTVEKKAYYLKAIDGLEPFAYLMTYEDIVMFEDAYQYKIMHNNLAFNLTGDIPLGSYRLSGQAADVAGNISDIFLTINFTEQRLSAPQNLTISSTLNSVTLNWDALAEADFYNVYYKKGSDSSYRSPIRVATNYATINNLESGIQYDFMVCAVDQDDKPGESSFASAKTLAAPVVPAADTPTASTTTTTQPKKAVKQPRTYSSAVVNSASAAQSEKKVEISKDESQPAADEGLTSSDSTERIDYTPWVVLLILILLAGAATGAYFYWFTGEDEREAEAKTDVNSKAEQLNATKTSGINKPQEEPPTKKRW